MKSRHLASWWLIPIDVLLIELSFLLGYGMRYELQWFRDVSYYHPVKAYIPFSLLFALLTLAAFQVDRVYYHWERRSWLEQAYHITNATAKSVVVILAITFIFQPLLYSRLLLIESGVIGTMLLVASRAVYTVAIGRLRARGVGVTPVLIIGAGEAGRTMMRTIVARPELGYQVVGFIDDDPQKALTDIGRFKALGQLENLVQVTKDHGVEDVIITLPWAYHRKILSIVRQCERHEIKVHIVPDLFQLSLSKVDIENVNGIPLIGIREVGFSRGALVVKRVIDVTGSLVLLVVGAPFWGLISLAVVLDSPGPVLFRQTRTGIGGSCFQMYKFRSMRKDAEEELENLLDFNEASGPMFKMKEDPRVTRVGRFLRRTSLDELPQLLNVLRGEMSLVGPRPPLPAEVDGYVSWHMKRLDVPPGITGLWQVSGRSLLSFDDQVLLDIYYIENWSLWLDFKILLRTVPQVLAGDGAY